MTHTASRPTSTTRRALSMGIVASLLLTQNGFSADVNFWTERAARARRVTNEPITAWAPEPRPGPSAFLSSLASSVQEESADPLDRLASRLGQYGHWRRVDPAVSRKHFWVVLVQDVHGIKEAQESVSRVVETVLNLFPRATAVLEGAAGTLDVESVRAPGGGANRAGGSFLFDAGLLSGAEKALLSADHARARGGESPTLYLKNLAAVHRARLKRESWTFWGRDIEAAFEKRKAAAFPTELLAFDAESRRYQNGEGRLTAHAETLLSRLPSTAAGFPTLNAFGQLMAIEDRLVKNQVERERNTVVEKMKDTLRPERAREFLETVRAFRAGGTMPEDFYARLSSLLKEAGVSLADCPQFALSIEHARLAAAIRVELLDGEIYDAEDVVAHRWTTDPAVGSLWERARVADLIKKLTELSLTPREWKRYQTRRDVVRNILMDRGLSLADVKAAEDFYRLADARNRAFVDTTRDAVSEGADGVVLVAGGFHTDGLVPLLRDAGATVLAVTPQWELKNSTPDGVEMGKTPYDILFAPWTPVEELFQAPRLTLSPPLSLSPLGNDPRPQARGRAARALARPVWEAVNAVSAQGKTSASVDVPTARANTRVAAWDERVEPPAGRIVAQGALPGVRVAVMQSPPRWSQRIAQSAARFGRWVRGPGRVYVKAGVVVTLFLLGSLISFDVLGHEIVQRGAAWVYTAAPGDNLWSVSQEILQRSGISQMTGQDIWDVIARIVKANDTIHRPDLIYAGQSYQIPSDLMGTVSAPFVPVSPVERLPAPSVSVAPVETTFALPAPAVLPGGSSPRNILLAASAVLRDVDRAVSAALGVSVTHSILLPVGVLLSGVLARAIFKKNRETPVSKSKPRPILSLTQAVWEVSHSKPFVGVVGAGLILAIFPGWAPVAWVSQQLSVVGFDTFFKIVSVIALVPLFQFVFALRRQATSPLPKTQESNFHAWTALLDRDGPWSVNDMDNTVSFARALIRQHKFDGSKNAATNAQAFHLLSHHARATVSRLLEQDPHSAEARARAFWFKDVADYALQARKLTVESVINVEHMRLKYGGTRDFSSVLGRYLRSPRHEFNALFFDAGASRVWVSAWKEVLGRYFVRPLFGMSARLREQKAKFPRRAQALIDLGNELVAGLYTEALRQEWQERLFDRDIVENDKPGLPGVWDGRNLVSPVMTLLFTALYASHIVQTTTLGVPLVLFAAFMGGLGIMGLVHRLFLAKGFWDPAYHNESQSLRLLREMRVFEGLQPFEDLAFDREWRESRRAWERAQHRETCALNALVLVARDATQEDRLRDLAQKNIPAHVRVQVVRQAEGQGTGDALAQAMEVLGREFSQEGLSKKKLAILYPESRGTAAMDVLWSDVGGTAWEIQLWNAFKAAETFRANNEGGVAYFPYDRPYIGPTGGDAGTAQLLSVWKNRTETVSKNFGVVLTDAEGRVAKVVGKAGYASLNKHAKENDTLKRTNAHTGVQALSGAGTVGFGNDGVFRAFMGFAEAIRLARRDAPNAPDVDLVDDVLIPLQLLCVEKNGSALGAYLGARGDLSPETEDRRRFFMGLFDRFQNTFNALPQPPFASLHAHTPPERAARFVTIDPTAPNQEALRHTRSTGSNATSGGRWEEATDGTWKGLRFVYKFSPPAVTAVAALFLSVGMAWGSPLSPAAVGFLPTSLTPWGFGGVLLLAWKMVERRGGVADDVARRVLNDFKAVVRRSPARVPTEQALQMAMEMATQNPENVLENFNLPRHRRWWREALARRAARRDFRAFLEMWSARPVEDVRSRWSVYRVNELMESKDAVTQEHLRRRARLFSPEVDAPPVFLLTGQDMGLSSTVLERLRASFGDDPAVKKFLKAARVVILPEPRVSIEWVLAALPERRSGEEVSVFTRDAGVFWTKSPDATDARVYWMSLLGGMAVVWNVTVFVGETLNLVRQATRNA